jgi:transposase
MRYELTDFEWADIKPMLPNKPRGVPHMDDRRVLNGIFWVLRSGASWRDLPQGFGPYTEPHHGSICCRSDVSHRAKPNLPQLSGRKRSERAP